MVARSKLYSKLDVLEIQLREEIVPHLERAASGDNNLIFCVSAFNPFRELRQKTDEKTEELINFGSQILSLKEKLGESSEGSIAERICWYCREWGNTGNHHRNSAQELAKQFLKEIHDN